MKETTIKKLDELGYKGNEDNLLDICEWLRLEKDFFIEVRLDLWGDYRVDVIKSKNMSHQLIEEFDEPLKALEAGIETAVRLI